MAFKRSAVRSRLSPPKKSDVYKRQALDVVAGAIMGLSKANNPLLLAAEQRGLGPVDLDQVELIGLDKAELPVPGYKLPPAPKGNMVGLPAVLNPFVDLTDRKSVV